MIIPIVSIFDLISALFSAIICVRVYITYRKTRSTAVLYFTIFFLFFTMFWLSAGSPGIFLFNSNYITVSNILSYVAEYLALIFIIHVPFIFIEKRWAGYLISILLISTGLVFVIGRIQNFELPKMEIFYPYVYWKPIYPVWMRIMTGVMSAMVAIISTIVFFQFGIKNRKNLMVFNKSMYLSSGMLALFIAALVSYVLSPTAGFAGIILSSLFGILGLWLLLQGILYDERHSELMQQNDEKNV